jgi:hypothetical protein
MLVGEAVTELSGGGLTVRVADIVLPKLAAIVACVAAATAVVVTAKVAVVCPAATVTLAGTAADPSLLERPIAIPPVGATPLNVTVPVGFVTWPTTVDALRERDETVGGVTVRPAVAEAPSRVAVIVVVACAATATVVAVNVAVVWPAATVTEAGTVAAAVFELVMVTTTPPAVAALESVIVPVAFVLPWTLAGLTATPESLTEITLRLAVWVDPAPVAEMTTVASAWTILDVTVNVAVVCPAATVTDAGTVAALVALLLRLITVPPLGAAAVNVTVAVAFAEPPITELGLTTKLWIWYELIVSVVVTVAPPYVAEMVTVVGDDTVVVVTVKVAVVAPAAIVSLAGNEDAVLLSDSVTTTPPVGAGPLIVTVPVVEDGLVPTTDDGLTATEVRTGGLIARVAVAEVAP